MSAEDLQTFVRVNMAVNEENVHDGADTAEIARNILQKHRTLCPDHVHTYRAVETLGDVVSYLGDSSSPVVRILITDDDDGAAQLRHALQGVQVLIVGYDPANEQVVLPQRNNDEGVVVSLGVFLASDDKSHGRALVDTVETQIREQTSDMTHIEQFAFWHRPHVVCPADVVCSHTNRCGAEAGTCALDKRERRR
jgi:hypothetical protein